MIRAGDHVRFLGYRSDTARLMQGFMDDPGMMARYIKTLEKVIAAAMGTSREVRALQHKHWLRHIRTTLIRKMVVRGGHLQNHKKRIGFTPALSSVFFQKMNGRTCGMEQLDAFADCLRQEVGDRIMDLLAY